MSIRIIRQGIFDTIQDMGRTGYRHLGITRGGVMDSYSAGLANALLGNEPGDPVLEFHFPSPVMVFEKPAVICLAGGDFTPMINGAQISCYRPLAVHANAVLSFAGIRHGVRGYLAVLHGFRASEWLGGRGTHLAAGAGGYQGRLLRTGDQLRFERKIPARHFPPESAFHWGISPPVPDPFGLECIRGNEWHWLTEESQEQFTTGFFSVSPSSDRMACRLTGEPLARKNQEEMVSSPVTMGTIQLLPDGKLVVLMADHQTTGGYPRIAHMVSTDTAVLAQVQANGFISFRITDIPSAEKKAILRLHFLQDIQNQCKLKMKTLLDAY